MIEKVVIFIFSFFFLASYSQSEKKRSIHYKNESLKVVLKSLEKEFDVHFSYNPKIVSNLKISLKKTNASLTNILFEISNIIPIQFNKLDNKYYYLSKKTIHKLDEVVISNYLTSGISKKNNATFKIKPKSQGLLAGLTETDILESIQQLPGVVSINETATDLVVRGGNTDQNQIIWDNINIYHGGHLFGMVSVFNPNIAKNITFYNKGTNVKFGERVSSVIDIKTNNNIIDKTNLEFGFNGINTDVVLKTPIVKDKLSAQFSFRRSYEDLFETITFKNFEQKAFQQTKIDEEFFYFKDYNFKLNYKPNLNSSLHLSYIHIDNDLENDFSNIETNTKYFDILDSENDGYMLNWKYKWNKNIKQETYVSLSKYRLSYNFITKQDGNLLSDFSKSNTINDLIIFTDFSYRTKNFNTINLGYQTTVKDVNFLFKEQRDILYILDRDDAVINTHSLFTSYSFNQPERFSFYSGLRVNYYTLLNTYRFEPRIILNTKINENLKFQITGEIKNQIISQIDETVLSDLSLENKLWRLANNNNHPIINGKQLTGGFSYTKNKWALDFDLYHKLTKGITALSLGFLNPNDNAFHTGMQKTTGVDFYVKRDFDKFKTWISYSFAEVDNKYENLNNNKYFTSNTEINHAITTSLSYKLNKLNLALGWKYRSGKPLTDLDYDENNVAYFDGINTEKLPSYHRLDMSATYNFLFMNDGKTRGKVGFSVRNIYNNKNHISTEFIGNNAIDDPIRIVKKYAIGITPNILFRVYW